MKTRHIGVIIFSVIFLLFQSASAQAALVAPANLNATAVSSNQINLTWTDTNSGKTNESGYSIERSNSPDTGFVKISSVGKNITTYSNTGLASGTTYYYRVQATGRKGAVSPYSNVANATTNQADITPPTVPTGLTATAASCSQINLSWSASTDTGGSGLKGYNVYKNGAYLKQVTTTSTTDTGLNASTSYSYTVSAVDNAGNQSAQSSASSASTPACPDTTPPTGTVMINGGATYANTTSVSLTLTASDNSGSVSQMCVSNTSSCTLWENYQTPKAWTLLTGDGTKTVYVWYRDAAGNTSTSCPDTIILDTTPPNSSITINWRSCLHENNLSDINLISHRYFKRGISDVH